jgi:hypothetical protein
MDVFLERRPLSLVILSEAKDRVGHVSEARRFPTARSLLASPTRSFASLRMTIGHASLNPMLLEPVPQRVPADAQPLGGTGLVAVALPERLLDERALPLVERHAGRWGGRILSARSAGLSRSR